MALHPVRDRHSVGYPVIAGIDYSSFSVDIVLLDDDTLAATWHRCALRGSTPFERARDARHQLPRWSWWEEHGVYLVAVEDPHSRAAHTAKALGLIGGAIAARLPAPLTVIQTAPVEWKRLTVGAPSASKEQVAQWARTMLGHDGIVRWSQDAYDAYAIARAVRLLNNQAIERAGAL